MASYARLHAGRIALDRQSNRPGENPDSGDANSVEALEELQRWATDPSMAPFAVLLGETGAGKTTTCRQLTRRLLAARAADPSVPIPIYLDLRNVSSAVRKGPTNVESIIDSILQVAQATDQRVTAAEILRLARSGKALLIFDGLDEVLVYLIEPSDRTRFVQLLWNILPVAGNADATGSNWTGKMLLSCRDHYFRTLREQINYFDGYQRHRIKADQDYLALQLKPLTLELITEYLRDTLPPEQDLGQAVEVLRTVHDLMDLARRPYLLAVIAQRLPELAVAGQVSAVTLYEAILADWLDRDEPKGTLSSEHKLMLMEQLAAGQWRSGSSSWTVSDLEQWLVDSLVDQAGLAAHYTDKPIALLKQDLRTATFVVRTGQNGYRFAHTSLQEYFLARYLVRGLREPRPVGWDLPVPSQETLRFVGQLLEAEPDPVRDEAHRRGLRKLVAEPETPAESYLVLSYVRQALGTDAPQPSLAGGRFEGLTDLRLDLRGTAERPMDLCGVSFRESDLGGSSFEHALLDGADFTDTDLRNVVFQQVRAREADFRGAGLAGAVFRRCQLTRTDFTCAQLHRAQWIDCELAAVTPSLAGEAGALVVRGFGQPDSGRPGPAVLHLIPDRPIGGVWGCAFSPDGARLAVADVSGEVGVLDSASGVRLADWSVRGPANGCAFSPDGARLAVAARGGMHILDAVTGMQLAEWSMSDVAYGCAFSPDGTRLAVTVLSAGVQVLDASTGVRLAEWWEAGDARACAFSPDGARLAVATTDGVKVLDALTGRRLSDWSGVGFAWGCAFSPDGARLAVATLGGVDVLDAASGVRLADWSLSGTAWGCAFSPDGARLALAGNGGVHVLDMFTGAWLADWPELGDARACAFSPDGARLAVAGKGGVQVLDAASGVRLADWAMPGQAWGCAFSPDGVRLAVAGNDGVQVLDAATGAWLANWPEVGEARGCAFSPDGARLAVAVMSAGMQVLDALTGARLAVWPLPSEVWGCAYSPDGTRMAGADISGGVRVLDVLTGAPLTSWLVASCVRECDLSSDGAWLAVAAANEGFLVLDAETGQPHLTVATVGGETAVFDADGRLLSASENAWRWLSYRVPDPDRPGEIVRWPAETFGPLPGPDGNIQPLPNIPQK